MGVISRMLFPACGTMCVCCPAMRPSSRKPVKRYKKLLAEIFPKSLDGPPNGRKIAKLCEYAAKNPHRIPTIAYYLEERCYKELRCEQTKFINVVMEAYNGLLHICKDQMAYFAVSLLNVVAELFDNSKQEVLRILGCKTLATFIYHQTDAIYTHNIDGMVHKVCAQALEGRKDEQRHCLKAASLQCLSAMVWYMAKFSTSFVDSNEIVHVVLDNYKTDSQNEDNETHNNWVNEVVRSDRRECCPSWIVKRPHPAKKDHLLLTREEIESPKIWVQICIQNMAELAKESATMHQILDPMFVYFDTGRHWASRQGLAVIILSDMSYFIESTGNPQLILSAVIRHLDHKNVALDPQVKSYVVQVAASLARTMRSGLVLSEIGFVSDLCRHLRKSLQATVESVREQELNLNVTLQQSIEDCLLEIAKGIGNASPLYDMMVVTLEKLPSFGLVARATIRSLIILAHTISLASIYSHSQQIFPEALLVQLLKAMMHPDVDARVGAHQIFSALLIPESNSQQIKFRSDTVPRFDSITALLEKLRRDKDSANLDNHVISVEDENRERDIRSRINSPNFYKLGSIVDKTAGSTCFAEPEPFIMKFNEDQISQLLSGFWVQAILPDNSPSNFEAIGHCFSLTLISLRSMYPKSNLVTRFFQLLLSLRNMALCQSNGMLPPARQRSVLVLSTGLLMFAAKIYHIGHMNDFLKSVVPHDVDCFVHIKDDLQVYVKNEIDVKQYGSFSENQAAASLLLQLRDKIYESDSIILNILTTNLSNITEMKEDELAKQLSEPFTPDDEFMFGPQSVLDSGHIQMLSRSTQSLSFDGDFLTNLALDDDIKSDLSVVPHVIPKTTPSTSLTHIISIRQLMDSALEVASQVSGSCVSASHVPYSTIAGHCEALEIETKSKLSNWMARENHHFEGEKTFQTAFPLEDESKRTVITRNDMSVTFSEPWLTMRLPPASPFDNFLRAARY